MNAWHEIKTRSDYPQRNGQYLCAGYYYEEGEPDCGVYEYTTSNYYVGCRMFYDVDANFICVAWKEIEPFVRKA